MQFYRINEFAHMIGVSKNTLRNWDEKGILKPHHKMPNGTTGILQSIVEIGDNNNILFIPQQVI